MSMLNTGDFLETIEMFTEEQSGRADRDHGHLPAGLHADPDGPKKACEKVYRKIADQGKGPIWCKTAVEHHQRRPTACPSSTSASAVTPIAMLLACAARTRTRCGFAKALDAAGQEAVGVNFVGGYSALVHKGFSGGRRAAHPQSIPARAGGDGHTCAAAVNVGCHQERA